jgi:hypothetical protein
MRVFMLVSKSDAESVSSSCFISNKKLSRIGRVLFEFNTPFNNCNCFKRPRELTMNFMCCL